MNEFDDPELERMLGRASGAYPDANVAFEVMRGRVRQVKRRRAIMASTAACAMLVGVVALAVRGGESDANLQPSHSLSDHSSVKAADTTEATDSSMAEPSSSVEDTSGDAATTTTMTSGDGNPVTVPGNHHTTVPGKGAPNSGPGDAHTTTTTATVVTVSPTNPGAMVTTYSSAGGSLVIQVVNNRMVLVAENPAAGYTAHNNEVGGDRIRVEFNNGQHMYEIQLQLSDGKVSSSTQNKG